MSYEDDAKELMKKFKLQHEQTMKHSNPNADNKIAEILNRNKNINSMNSDKNQDISELINKSNLSNSSESTEQGIYQNGMNRMNTGGSSESTEQGPYKDIIEKGKSQNINFTPPQSQGVPTIPSTPVNGNVCSQCNTLHPPLRPGEPCPNKTSDVSAYGLDETTVNKFIVDIRNMIISQMDLKKIKDGKKFFQFTIIELMKILEEYNE